MTDDDPQHLCDHHCASGECYPDLIDKIKPHLGTTMGPLTRQMGQSSLFNLASAFEAMRRDGVAGQLIIDVPANTASRLEVDWIATRNTKD